MNSVSLLLTPPVSPNGNSSIATKMTLPSIRDTFENNNNNNINNDNHHPNHIPNIDINILKKYLTQGGSCNIRHPGTGLSLLCWAIKSESMIGIQLLLDHWCTKEDKTKDRLVDLFCFPSKHGVTPIHMLADQGFMQGFYLFEQYYEQQQEQQKRLLKHILLSTSISSPSTSSSSSSVSSSILNSNSSYIDWLNILDHKGKTPLHYAVQKNQCQAVHYLLYHGASSVIKDQLGHTPLTLALLHQTISSSINVDILQLLIHTLNDDSMVTLLQRPHQYQFPDQLWYYLFQHHYDQLYLKTNKEKDQWIYLCVFWNRSDILSKLLQYQKENQELPYFEKEKKMKSDDSNNKNADDLNDNQNNDDPLYLAVQQRKLDIVKQLCQAGYSSKVRSDGFNSCLLYAATHGFLEMIPLLYTPTTSNHCMELCLQLVNPTNRSQLEQEFDNAMSFNKLLNLDPMNISSIINFDSSF